MNNIYECPQCYEILIEYDNELYCETCGYKETFCPECNGKGYTWMMIGDNAEKEICSNCFRSLDKT